MRTWILVLVLLAVTACTQAPSEDIIGPNPPPSLDANEAGQAILTEDDFAHNTKLAATFAPPYDVWHDNTQLIDVPWDATYGEETYLNIVNDDNEEFLAYNTAYVLNAQTGKWKPLRLTGEGSKYTGFLTETDFESIPPDYVAVGDNYIAAYVCTATDYVDWRGGLRKAYACGCSEDNIKSCGKWNLQRLTVHETAVCGDNTCAVGETPWTCEADCTLGPNAPTNLTDAPEETKFCTVYGLECEATITSEHISLWLRNNNEPKVITEVKTRHTSSLSDCTYTGKLTLQAEEETTLELTCAPALPTSKAIEMYFDIHYAYEDNSYVYSTWGYLRGLVGQSTVSYDTVDVTIAGQKATVGEQKEVAVNANGKTYAISALVIGYDQTQLLINGQMVKPLSEGMEAIVGDTTVRLDKVYRTQSKEEIEGIVQFSLYDVQGTYVLSDSMYAGETKAYTVAGETHNITALYLIGDSTASFMVDGEPTAALRPGQGYTTIAGVGIGVISAVTNDLQRSCVDNDGNNKWYQGTTTYTVNKESQDYIDTCIWTRAFEFLCDEDYLYADVIPCENGCINGACSQNPLMEVRVGEQFQLGADIVTFSSIDTASQTIEFEVDGTTIESPYAQFFDSSYEFELYLRGNKYSGRLSSDLTVLSIAGATPVQEQSTALVEYALGGQTIYLGDDSMSRKDEAGTVAIDNRVIDDGRVDIDARVVNNKLVINSITYELIADAARQSDIYVPRQESVSTYMDAPEGLLSAFMDITFSRYAMATEGIAEWATVEIGSKNAAALINLRVTDGQSQSLAEVKPVLTKDDLEMLQDSEVTNQFGRTTVTQTISLATTDNKSGRVINTKNNDNEQGSFLYYKEGDSIFSYTAQFNQGLQSSIEPDVGSASDLELQRLVLFGEEYVIVHTYVATSPGRDSINMDLIKGGHQNTLSQGQSQTVVVNGKEYEITALSITTTDGKRTVKFLVNGEVTDDLGVGDSYMLADGISIVPIDLIEQSTTYSRGFKVPSEGQTNANEEPVY